MLGPAGERRGNLAIVAAAVVDAGNPGAVATVVVKHRFDDVRHDADLGHVGRAASSEIVHGPLTHAIAEALVERTLHVAPAREPPTVGAKEVVAAGLRPDGADNVERGCRQHDQVRPPVLRALLRQAPGADSEIDLVPAY